MFTTWINRGPYRGEQVTVLRNDPRKASRVVVRRSNGEEVTVAQLALWQPGGPLPPRDEPERVSGGSVRTVSGGLPTLGKR